jgi:outer membrane lipoprotein-sorting protein
MRTLLIPIFLICLPALGAETLDSALTHLDKAGGQFKGMDAKFAYLKHTAVVNDNSEATGKIKIKKDGKKIQALLNFETPVTDKKDVELNNDTVRIFLPNANTLQKYNLAEHKGLVEQFILFGFGTSRRDLETNYNVFLGGQETINGEEATRLVMTSKNQDMAKQLTQFELWISNKTGEPVRQKFTEPSGDFHVFTYSDMHLQVPRDLTLKLPKNVRPEKTNK